MAFVPTPGYYRYRYKASTAGRTPSTFKTPAARATKKYPIRKTKTGTMVPYGGSSRGRIRLAFPTYRRRRKTAITYKVPQGVGSTFSKCSYGNMKMSKPLYNYWRNNQQFKVSTTFSQKLQTTGYGLQAVNTMVGISAQDFLDDLARVGITDAYAKPSTSLIYQTVTDIITYTNVELTTTYLHIYEMVPRRDLSGTAAFYPDQLWQTGLNEEVGGTTGASIIYYPYEKPFRSRKFCLNYLVKKVIELELAPGESHKHTVTYGINRLVHGAIATAYGLTKDYTQMRMHVASGTPINDATNKTFVSTSTVSIDIVLNREWYFGIDARPRLQTFASNALNTITSAKVITDTSAQPDTNA